MAEAQRSRTGRKRDGGFEWGAVRALLPYMWPKGYPEIKVRVVIGLVLLALAKGTNVYVPILYKLAVDALSPKDHAAVVVLPIALILGYGIVRVASIAFGELRDAVFAKVEQNAIRVVALKTFRHLHSLALRFHLERQTGGLSRAIERGTKGIDFLLRFMAVQHPADPARDLHGLRHALGVLQFLVRPGHVRIGDGLHRLHRDRHRVAHQIPPPDERDRPGGQHPRHRLPAQLRDREVFRQRGARGQPLRSRARPLRAGGGAVEDLALDAERRPGLHHRHRPRRRSC